MAILFLLHGSSPHDILPPVKLLYHLTHGVTGFVQVDDGGLLSNHHGQAVDDTLAANATVSETLEGEVVWATGWGCIDLHCACLHGIADADGCVDILCEQAPLRNTQALLTKVLLPARHHRKSSGCTASRIGVHVFARENGGKGNGKADQAEQKLSLMPEQGHQLQWWAVAELGKTQG